MMSESLYETRARLIAELARIDSEIEQAEDRSPVTQQRVMEDLRRMFPRLKWTIGPDYEGTPMVCGGWLASERWTPDGHHRYGSGGIQFRFYEGIISVRVLAEDDFDKADHAIAWLGELQKALSPLDSQGA